MKAIGLVIISGLKSLVFFCAVAAILSAFVGAVESKINNQPQGQYPEEKLDPLERWESNQQFPIDLVDSPITPEIREMMRKR